MKVRVTGIVIENSQLLLINQDVDNKRSWSLPGGTLEEHETLKDALIREMKEETGLIVKLGKLLYICDLIDDSNHVIHITFLATVSGGKIGNITEGVDTRKIRSVQFVPITELTNYGFSKKFMKLVLDDFPKRGSYLGPKSAIGL
jgi:ADP-ribose pyrophosphatase YjhB (NUDIX family)